MNKVERRYLQQEFRISGDSGAQKIEGYAAKFGIRSEDFGGWVEVIAPTAFDVSLASNPDVRALFNHDPNLILGRTASGTLTLTKDDTGLAYSITPPDTQTARDLMVSMNRGDVNQSSFGFVCVEAAWGYDEVLGLDIRTVKQVELWDVSPVVFPAYPDANSGVRSMPSDMPMEVRSKLSKRAVVETPNAAGCSCICGQCVAGACGLCSNADCVDELCCCVDMRSWKADTELRLRIAQAQ